MTPRTAFGRLYPALSAAGYAWTPQTPDRLLSMRRAPERFDALEKFFGLGLDVPGHELLEAGAPEDLLPWLLKQRPAVSRVGDRWVAHDHFLRVPRDRAFVYCGSETERLLQCVARAPEELKAASILDLGSGGGALALALAADSRNLLGLEISPAAVEWARASAQAQGLGQEPGQIRFESARIGEADADRLASSRAWDLAVFNPPMAVPTGAPRPQRDGGDLGVELPLLFLDFASRHLRTGGEARFLFTNPILRGGTDAGMSRIPWDRWTRADAVLLDGRFNASLHRKDGYAKLGIERIQLWYLRLRRSERL